MEYHLISLGDHLIDPFTGKHNESQAVRFNAIVKQGVLAEKLGFSGVWIGEHHSNDYIVSNPQMILAAIASQTQKIKLGSAISLLPNTDPVRLAEDFATLDLLSNGRAEIGFGGGITPYVFKLFGQDVADADAIFRENFDLIQKLWNEEVVNWSGKFRPALENFRLEPRTFTGRALPITRAAGTTQRTAIEAGRDGHKLALLTVATGYSGARPLADLYRKSWAEAGRNPADASLKAAAFIYCREDGKRARDHWSNYILNYKTLGQSVRQSQGWSEGLNKLAQELGEKALDVASESWISGDPSEVAERLERAYEGMGGFNELHILFDVGGLPSEEVYESMKIFRDKVVPKLSFKPKVEVKA